MEQVIFYPNTKVRNFVPLTTHTHTHTLAHTHTRTHTHVHTHTGGDEFVRGYGRSGPTPRRIREPRPRIDPAPPPRDCTLRPSSGVLCAWASVCMCVCVCHDHESTRHHHLETAHFALHQLCCVPGRVCVCVCVCVCARVYVASDVSV